MTARWSTVVLQALIGAVAREIGLALLAVADTLDPPVTLRAPIDDVLYVPDYMVVDQ